MEVIHCTTPTIINWFRPGLLLGLGLWVLSSVASGAEHPVVHAAGEELHGRWSEQTVPVAEFLGIPFAAPPVGDLRWRAPQEPKPRTEPQSATRFAPACMQGSSNVDWYASVASAFGYGREVVGRPDSVSEDCLYMNVWTPDPGGSRNLPVMVFVHGGSNKGGWSYEPNYIGARLAARGVVVVTITYRLGPFGFFAHPALTNETGEPRANFALLDIEAAFRWVRDHIRAFGGAPGNITAFGESSGAASLTDLLLASAVSPRSGPLPFRRLIAQSAPLGLAARRTLEEEQALGLELVSYLGVDGPVGADRLRNIPAEDLLAAADRLPTDHYFDAAIDGDILPADLLRWLDKARLSGVEIILGTNADEWLMYIDENATSEDLGQWIRDHAPQHRDELLDAVSDEPDPRRKLDRVTTAHDMLCASRYLAERINDAGGRGWIYLFSRQRSGKGGDKLGAYHGAELPYVFDSHDAWLPVEKADRRLTDAVQDYWLHFAKTGKPAPEGQPAWPVYTRENPVVLELGEAVKLRKSETGSLCGIFRAASTEGTE